MSFILHRVIAACVLLRLFANAQERLNGSQPTTGDVRSTNGPANLTNIPEPTSSLLANGTTLLNATSSASASATYTTSNTSTIDPVIACDKRWSSYYASSILAYKPTSERTFTKVVISTETVYGTTYTCSSTCGNVCYADVTTTETDFSTITSTQLSTSTAWSTYTGPQPSCTVPSAACTSLWDVFSQSKSVYMSWYNNMGPPESEPPWPSTPACKYCKQTDCFIFGSGKIQIYYWPESTTVVRDMCTDAPAQAPFDPWQSGTYANTSYVPVTTGGSVVLDGRTFYEGNVYFSIPAASVTNNCGATLGSVHSDILLTLASSDIYSVRNDRAGVYPISYADFNPPYPWSAYRGALHDCASGMNFGQGPWCSRSVVFEDNFHPVVQLPISMQQLDPAWVGCKPIDALLDPPVALSTVANLLTSRYNPPIALSTAALPASTPEAAASRTPASTAVPSPAPGPDRNADQPGHGGSDNQLPHTAPAGQGNPITVVPPQITVGPTVLPVRGTGLVIQPGVTVSRGGPAAIIGGTTVRLGDASITLESPSGTSTIAVPNTYFSFSIMVGGRQLTFLDEDNIVAQPVLLDSNDPAVTVAGSMIVSAGSSGITIIDIETGNIQYIPFERLASMSSVTAVRVGGQVLTLDANGDLILGSGKTLHPGDPAVTISGTVVSIGTAGIVLVDSSGVTKTLSEDATRTMDGAGATTMGDQGSTRPGEEQNAAGTAAPTNSKKAEASTSKAAVIVQIIALLILGSAFQGLV